MKRVIICRRGQNGICGIDHRTDKRRYLSVYHHDPCYGRVESG